MEIAFQIMFGHVLYVVVAEMWTALTEMSSNPTTKFYRNGLKTFWKSIYFS